ncbi:MAG: DNA repair protein RecO [Desulfosarcinaceae bacterium]|nr:DNA repair protein RecO [Desulfosarcinaceae bacterium]
MPPEATTAIVLRRVEYGDYDLIVTLLTPDQGKVSVIAKSAKKSTKRFPGILELFAQLDVVLSRGRRKNGLAVLQEASLTAAYFHIRESILKTAYASYWSEMLNLWLEADQPQPELYDLLAFVLAELDAGHTSPAVLSLLFQLRLMGMAGFRPDLEQCSLCRCDPSCQMESHVYASLRKGGIICCECAHDHLKTWRLSKGSVKQLRWLERGDPARARRLKFSPQTLAEGQAFLEAFVPYHLGREPRSLRFLQHLRRLMASGQR